MFHNLIELTTSLGSLVVEDSDWKKGDRVQCVLGLFGDKVHLTPTVGKVHEIVSPGTFVVYSRALQVPPRNHSRSSWLRFL